MEDKNNSYLKDTRKLSENIAFKIIWPILIILYVVLNPILIFVFAFLIAFILFAGFKSKIFCKKFIYLTLFIYTLLLAIYSISPKLKYYEFAISHYNWVETEGIIKKYNSTWKEIYRRKSPQAVADINYTFKLNNKEELRTEFEACRIYQYRVLGNSEENKKYYIDALNKQIDGYIKNNNYKILVNPKDGESRLFIPLDNILLKNSATYNLVLSFGQYILVFLGIVLVIFLIGLGLDRFKSNN